MKADQYNYWMLWCEESEEWVGLCCEFPELHWQAPTPEEALDGIQRSVAEVLIALQRDGIVIPQPVV